MIQERFDELHPYLKGVKISDEFVIVESMIKTTWKIRDILPEDVQIQTKDENRTDGLKYHMFYSSERTIDDLVDVLELIVNINIELEQKQELLKSKVEELKKMFQDKPLDELMSLKFTSEIDVDLKPNKPQPPITQVIREGENPNTTKSNVSTEKV
jgi:hypothetical protein